MRFNEICPEERTTLPTLEAIATQSNDPFCAQLEGFILEYINLVNDGKTAKEIDADTELKNRFQKAVFDRFGVSMVLICDRLDAACIPNVYTEHNSLIRSELAKYLKQYGTAMGLANLRARPANGVLGTADTRKVKLTGWLSEQPVPIFMNFHTLVAGQRLTLLEIASVFMHELGHVFNSAAKVATVSTQNQAINEAIQRVQKMQEYGETTMIYKEYQTFDPEMSKDIMEGLQSGNGVVFGISAFRATLGAARSLSGSAMYDDTSSEASADAFAASFGYAVALATGLDKLQTSPSRLATKYVVRLLNVFLVYVMVTNLFALFSMAYRGVLFKRSLLSLVFIVAQVIGSVNQVNAIRFSKMDYEYDKDKDRIKRMRLLLVEQLKDPEIPKSTKRVLVEQITIVRDIEDRQEQLPKGIQKALAFLTNRDRQTYKSVETQQQIEEMISNDLFVAASKLEANS